MRIALLTSTFPLNRDEQDQAVWILEIIRGLQAEGHYVAVYTHHRPGSQENFDGMSVERFPWSSRNKRLVELSMRSPLDLWAALSLLLAGTSRLPEFLRRHRIDLCLVFWALPSGWYAYRTLGKTGIPYRVWALGSDINKYGHTPLGRFVLRRVLRASDSIFADSFELAERIEREFGVGCQFLATTRTVPTVPPSMPSRPDGYAFLYVGRLATVKGIDILLEAARHLPAGSRLSIAGAGPLSDTVREAATRIGDQVRILGRISDQALAGELAACDCVVIPSRSETIPIVLSESLQFGKRVIVTDVGDMGVIVRRYSLGEVVPAENPAALAKAMERAVSDEASSSYDPEGWREARRLFEPGVAVKQLASPSTRDGMPIEKPTINTMPS